MFIIGKEGMMRLFIFIGVIFFLDELYATTYYVSPSGNDTNPGTYEHPWATPGYGSKQISPGDTLIMLPGTYVLSTYYDDMITPPSGTQTAYTVIMGYGDSLPVLAGKGSLLSAIDISNLSYVKIANLELTSYIDTPYSGGMREGIEAGGAAGAGAFVSHIIIENVVMHHLEECGINFAGDIEDVRVSGCSIHHTGMSAISAPAGTSYGWRNVIIDNTYLGYAGYFYMGRDTISPYDRPDGIGMEPSEGPLEIYNVISEHNRGDGIDSKSRRTFVHNCIIANNWADGLKLWGDSSKAVNVLIYGTGDRDTTPTPWSLIVVESEDTNGYFEFINITAYDVPSRNHYSAYFQYSANAPINVLLRNTIISGGRRVYFGNAVNLTADHNLFYINEDVQVYANGREYTSDSIFALGEGNIYGDPLFVRPAWGTEGDFHLKEGSPAIDAGTAEGAPDVDLEYNERPYGNAIDIGAYEYHPEAIKERKEKTKIEIYPTLLTSSNELKIIFPEILSYDASLQIFDINGRLIKCFTLTHGKRGHRVSLNISSGVYFIRIKLKHLSTMKKIIKVK